MVDTNGDDSWVLSDVLLKDYMSFLASDDLPHPIPTASLALDESEIFWKHSIDVISSTSSLFNDHSAFLALPTHRPSHTYTSKQYDLTKEPMSYTEAIARPDAYAWRAAMEREKTSLRDMGAFEEVDLPKGEWTIGLKWVYAYKKNAEGVNIMEKARVVAQGFNQRPGQFNPELHTPPPSPRGVRAVRVER